METILLSYIYLQLYYVCAAPMGVFVFLELRTCVSCLMSGRSASLPTVSQSSFTSMAQSPVALQNVKEIQYDIGLQQVCLSDTHIRHLKK